MSDIQSFDQELWARFKSGDQAALSEIYHRYYQDLYRYGLKLTGSSDASRDCIHSFFLYIWEKRAGLQSLHSIKYYLIKSFRRHALRVVDRERRVSEIQIPSLLAPATITFSHEEVLADQDTSEQRKRYVTKLLNSLSPRQREIIYLRYFEEMSPAEIAEILSINYQSVINHLHQALKRMRTQSPKPVWPLLSIMLCL